MGRFLNHEQLLAGLDEKSGFIQNGKPECAEGVKYDFRLSSRILKAKFKRPIDANLLSEREKGDLAIEPGEMVFVLSEERLNLPANIVAYLSPKRKLSHAGILAIGGLCIDPLYKGRLLVGLYNFSSTNFPIIPGKKMIAATFYELGQDETTKFAQPESSVEDFPEELIRVMQSYEPMTVKPVADLVNKLSIELETLRRDIRSHEDWYKRFEKSLDTHNEQIGKLTAGLEAEKTTRVRGEDKLSEALTGISGTLSWLRGAAWVIAGIISLVLIPLIGLWLAGKLKVAP